jgi:hypothetical protein
MKERKKLQISKAATANTQYVNVAIEDIDLRRVSGSFTVHLLLNGEILASRCLYRPSVGAELFDSPGASHFAHIDFHLPIDAIEGGTLSVEVESLDDSVLEKRILVEHLGNPTMAIYLMLETQ